MINYRDLQSFFVNVENKYRPIPFWSWNEKLNIDETKSQIGKMSDVGIGGFFMHARGGLQTEYMGEEWFDNIKAGIDAGKENGMYPWAYDENGWPSGFGSGKINALGIKYQQKYLRCEKGEKNIPETICNSKGYHFYYEVNPHYVDLLDKSVVKRFIDDVYAEYYERFGNDLTGFFTDEPQLSRDIIPWSFVLEKEYEKEYNECIFDILPDLFFESNTCKQSRIKFWRLVTKIFADSYAKQIYEWCEERNLKFTGHMLLEESMEYQLTTSGAVMPHYEYFHIPGMDWLSRNPVCKLTPLQLGSVAAQLGKNQVLSETFALTGWNATFEDLRKLYEQQMVRGVNLLCTHLAGYSLRGIRKRDFPASFFYHQPWWDKYELFIESMSRIGMLLSKGRIEYDTLLIHPQTTAWTLFDNDTNEGLAKLDEKFAKTIDLLERKHCLFHLGDETLMEKYAIVENGKMFIGTQSYKKVVVIDDTVLLDSTIRLLDEFKASGGQVLCPNEIKMLDIIDNENITYTKRLFDNFTMYYFVNSTECEQTVNIKQGTAMLDILTGDIKPFEKINIIPSGGSIVVFDGIIVDEGKTTKDNIIGSIELDGLWHIESSDLNAYTLDYCKYSFNGNVVEACGPVISIQEKACSIGEKVNVVMEFQFDVEYIPNEIYLVCETPEIFNIMVNDKKIENKCCGKYFDSAFNKINLNGCLQYGINKIVLECDFEQSEQVYENVKNATKFEGIKNKLFYDMEIESIYLVGDFTLKTPGEFKKLERDAVRYSDKFVISEPKSEIFISNIEQQGYPFFAGSMTLSKKFYVNEQGKYTFDFTKKLSNVVSVKINGAKVNDIIWKPYTTDLSDYIVQGENTLEITLTNSLRNLLGPHHIESGESYGVTPACFFKEETLWGTWNKEKWNDDYCFVEFGIKL